MANTQLGIVFSSLDLDLPNYNSVTTIYGPFSSNTSQLAQINSASDSATFPRDKEVIILVKCSCLGGYYQTNSTYVIKHLDTYFLVANNNFQGLGFEEPEWLWS